MAQGRKKLKVNPVSGNLDLVIDNNGVFVPMEGIEITGKRKFVPVTALINNSNGTDFTFTTPIPHGLITTNALLEVKGVNLVGTKLFTRFTSFRVSSNNLYLTIGTQVLPLKVGSSIMLSSMPVAGVAFNGNHIIAEILTITPDVLWEIRIPVVSANISTTANAALTSLTNNDYDASGAMNGVYKISSYGTSTILISYDIRISGTVGWTLNSPTLNTPGAHIPTELNIYDGESLASLSNMTRIGNTITATIASDNLFKPLDVGDVIYLYKDKPRFVHSTHHLNDDGVSGEKTILTRVGNIITFLTSGLNVNYTGTTYVTLYKNNPPISGLLKYEQDPRLYRDFDDDTLISKKVLDDELGNHVNDFNNPHDVNAFDINLDQLTNDKQIPLSGTLIGSNGAVIPSVAIIGIGGSTYRFFFTTSPAASGLVLGDTFQVTGALINPDFNQTDWVVTSVEINPYQYTFEAQSPSVGAGEPNNGFSSSGSTAAAGTNNVQEYTPSSPVTGNIQFTADPNTLPNWGRVSVASKGYVDDQVGANNGLSEILANDNTATVDIEITDASKGIILTSPNLIRWRITVGNDGSLTTTSL